jgi:nitroreductase
MGPPQWSDVGMYLQTVMLLLRDEGLHNCPQMAWAKYRNTVAEIVLSPDELMLFCGRSIGYEDVTVVTPVRAGGCDQNHISRVSGRQSIERRRML